MQDLGIISPGLEEFRELAGHSRVIPVRLKVLADATTDKVLGVHIYGPQAGELISEATMTMAFGGSSEDIARTCHPHPTRSEAVRQAAMGVDGWTMQA